MSMVQKSFWMLGILAVGLCAREWRINGGYEWGRFQYGALSAEAGWEALSLGATVPLTTSSRLYGIDQKPGNLSTLSSCGTNKIYELSLGALLMWRRDFATRTALVWGRGEPDLLQNFSDTTIYIVNHPYWYGLDQNFIFGNGSLRFDGGLSAGLMRDLGGNWQRYAAVQGGLKVGLFRETRKEGEVAKVEPRPWWLIEQYDVSLPYLLGVKVSTSPTPWFFAAYVQNVQLGLAMVGYQRMTDKKIERLGLGWGRWTSVCLSPNGCSSSESGGALGLEWSQMRSWREWNHFALGWSWSLDVGLGLRPKNDTDMPIEGQVLKVMPSVNLGLWWGLR